MEEMNQSTASADVGGGGATAIAGWPFHRLDWASALPVQELGIAAIAIFIIGFYTSLHFWLKNKNPGQMRTWPLIGSLPTLIPNWEHLFDFFANLHEKDEFIWVDFAFGFKGLYITNPREVEHILKANFANYPKGVAIQERMRELLGDGIFAADGPKWKQSRKTASLQFSSAILRDYSAEVFKELALSLGRIVSQFADNKTPVDMQDLFMRMTLDSTCKVGFGVELGCLAPSLPEVPFAVNFDHANELSFHRYADALWKVKRFFSVGNEKELKQCVDKMDEFTFDVIKKRRIELELENTLSEKPKSRPDLLTRFMSITDDEEGAYSDKALRDHVVNFIIAGRDTTAITLSWFIYRICLNPEVAEKIYVEVTKLEQEENGDVHSNSLEDFADVLNFYNVAKLQYLHAALTETLRLHPPVPMDGKIAENDDVLPSGVQIKKGTMVTYNAYAMGRLEYVWGPDAKEYKPERWLNEDGAFQLESPFKFVSFNAGYRACLGKESAYLQMKTTAALLVRFFKFELVPKQDIRPRVMFVLTMADGVKVNVTRR